MAEEKKSVLNTAAEGGAKKAAEGAADRALNWVIDIVGKKFGEAKVEFGSAFERYIDNAFKRYNKVKTITTGTEPRNIIGWNPLYVNIGVKYRGKEISTKNADAMLEVSNNILVAGSSGMGKSMLMRYLFLITAREQNRIPVLLELRRVDRQELGKVSLLELIYEAMADFDTELPREQFEYSLRSGKYLFLLDGFDEVKSDYSEETAAEIQRFSAKYPNNAYIVTSRPVEEWRFKPLETFTVMESMPMNNEQAVQMAAKIWPNDPKTPKFCELLGDDLYNRHRDFAENPLLLSMMFLTYMRNGSIPDHLADFYRKAYEALYSVHDNSDKGVFHRDVKCKTLDERSFETIFAHFCYVTYFQQIFEFKQIELETLLDASIRKYGVMGITAKNYLADLKDAVCMIVKDGEIYKFSHRSFQTYFAAVYTSLLSDEKQVVLFERLKWNASRFHFHGFQEFQDKDFYILTYQIEPERFCANVLEERLRQIKCEYDSSNDPDLSLWQIQYDEYEVFIKNKNEDEDNNIIIFLPENCLELFIFKCCVCDFVNFDNVFTSFSNGFGYYAPYTLYHTFRKMAYKYTSFLDLESDESISIEEQKKIFDSFIEITHTRELRAAIDKYISDLDAKQAALEQAGDKAYLDF